MTDDELKALVANNSQAIQKLREEGDRSRRDFDERWAKSEKAREAAQLAAEKAREKDRLAAEKAREEDRLAAEKFWRDFDERWEKSRREFQAEIQASREETDRVLRSFHKEQGRHDRRFGDHVEAMFLPSLKRILRADFGMKVISLRLEVEKGGENREFDLLAHGGEEKPEVYIAEIKAKLRQEGIDQLLGHLHQLPRLMPEHRGKKIFGILACIDMPGDLRARALKKGLYLATIKNDIFEISPPDGFEPRSFGMRVSQ